MKIAMIGHKDFPSRSGGVEVVVCELATRLAKLGVDVTVYNRGREKGHNKYKAMGVNVIRSRTFKNQSLNAMVYSFTATFNALFHDYDIIHYHAIGPSVPLVIAHFFGKKTVSTVHGLNWKVDKWNSFASRYLKLGERIAAKYADEVITLSDEMHEYFLKEYNRDTCLIKNAVSPIKKTEDDLIKEKFGLTKGEYILYVGRISPEKGVQDLISAYKKANLKEKLVIAGEVPEGGFGDEVRKLSGGDETIVFAGFSQGGMLASLYSNAALYVLPSHTEGLALTLLEALSAGANCLVSDIPENTAVLKNFGRTFKSGDIDDLKNMLETSVSIKMTDDEKEEEKRYIKENYSYDKVVKEHLSLYKRIAKKG